MKIVVFGMGHVGVVTAAMLAQAGHTVVGVDVDRDRLALLNLGRLPFREPELEEIVRGQLAKNLSFSVDGEAAVRDSDVSLICVGTPALYASGESDVRAVHAVLGSIAAGLAGNERHHVVALRSTAPPMAVQDMEARLQKRAGRAVPLVVNPEFLREGSAVADFRYPPFVVIGAEDECAGQTVAAMYAPFIDDMFGWAEIIHTDQKTALLVKYVSNAWHALKVTFANEVGDIARDCGVDPHGLMRVFAQDTRLNISAAYLRPGAPFGGGCLPKDLYALLEISPRENYLLHAVERSNAARLRQIGRSAKLAKRVGVVGLSFKRGTDDLRGSPWAQVVEWLISDGVEVRVYDPDVPDACAGKYAPYLCADFGAVDEWAEKLVVGKPDLLPPGVELAPERVIYGDSVS